MCTIFYYMFFQTENENKKIDGLSNKIKLDSMTDLLNKTAFRESCIEDIRSNISESLTFLFIDLDHFKEINDNFGHVRGDMAIVDAANVIKNAFEVDSISCRYGGDEFCVFSIINFVSSHQMMEQVIINVASFFVMMDYIKCANCK